MIAGILRADGGTICDRPASTSRADPIAAKIEARLHPRPPVHLREAHGRRVPAVRRRALRPGRAPRSSTARASCWRCSISRSGATSSSRATPTACGRSSSSRARSCIGREVIVVDEPMVGLDPKAARILKDLFREYTRARAHDHDVDAHARGGGDALRPRRRSSRTGRSARAARWTSCARDRRRRARARGDLPAAHRRERGARAWSMCSMPDGLSRRCRRACAEPRRRAPTRCCTCCSPSGSRRGRARCERDGDAARASRCSASIGLLFWAFIFGVLYRLLTYFRGVAGDRPAARRQAARARSSSASSRSCCCRTSSPRCRASSSRATSTCWWRDRWTGSRCTAPSCSRRW